MKAIRIHEPGGPEVLRYEDAPDPVAGTGEVVVALRYAGVNYGDTGVRRGTYPGGDQPGVIPGIEGVGVVDAIGESVTAYRPGDGVAIAGELGCYAERIAVPAARLIPLPAGIDARSAAAALQQGRTAHYLAHDAYPIQPGDRVLVHAGAGGVGMMLVQMAKRRGAYVYTTVSSDAKAAFARDIGADEVIDYTRDDFAAVVMDSTGGEGVQAVFDHVGRATFEGSLRCVGRRGHLVMYGQTSGPPPPLDIASLRGRGSWYISSHSGADYRRTTEELIARAHDVFRWVSEGEIRAHVHAEYPLAEAWRAHRDLESRETIGKLLLVP